MSVYTKIHVVNGQKIKLVNFVDGYYRIPARNSFLKIIAKTIFPKVTPEKHRQLSKMFIDKADEAHEKHDNKNRAKFYAISMLHNDMLIAISGDNYAGLRVWPVWTWETSETDFVYDS